MDNESVVVGVHGSVAVSVATSNELTASDDDSLMGCPAPEVKSAYRFFQRVWVVVWILC